MKIRNATKNDKKVISELYYELHPIEEEKENKEKGLLLPIEKSKIRSILLVAEENKQGEVIGFVWAHFIQYGFFKYGTIDEFFVKKEFRGKGTGGKLVKKAVKKLQKEGVKIILVGTEKENKEAIKLYQKVGFELGKGSLWFYWSLKKKR